MDRLVHPVHGEVEPQLLGAHSAPVHHLPPHAAPVRNPLVKQRRRVPRPIHLDTVNTVV